MSNPRTWVGAGLVLLALALSLLWRDSHRSGSDGGPTRGDGAARRAGAAGNEVTASDGVPEPLREFPRTSEETEQGETRSWPPPRKGSEVTVRVAVTEAPDRGVAGAEVLELVLEADDLDRVQESLAEGANLPDTYAALARSRRRTDGEGRAAVPRPETGLLWALAARHGGRFVMVLEPEPTPEGEVVLLLPPARTVVVRVEEEDGAPAGGVPVVFAEIGDEGRTRPRWTVRTDPRSGLAVFPNLEVFLPDAGSDRRVAFVVAAPLREPPRTDLAWGELPDEPIVLRLPAHGALEVRLLTQAGEPYPGPVTVTAYPRPKAGERPPPRWRRPRERSADGTALFPVVPLGESLVVEAFVADVVPFADPVATDGPERPGATRTVALRRPSADPIVTGRAVDGGGRPLAATELFVEALPDWAFAESGVVVATDETGRFALTLTPVTDPAQGPPAWLDVRLRGDPAIGAGATLPPLVPGRPADLGDLRLEPIPLLVAGVVLDPQGRPFPDLLLEVTAPARYGDEEAWRMTVGRGLRTDADGRFELRSHPAPWTEEHFLVVTSPHAWAPETSFVPGETLRLTAWRHAALSGRLLLDADHPPWARLGIESTLTRPDGSEQRLAYGVDDDGRFVLDGLVPGLAAAQLFHEDLPALALARLEGIEVGGADDPRLDPWDLRGRFTWCDLVVRGAEGGVIRRAQLRVPPDFEASAFARAASFDARRPYRLWLPTGERVQGRVSASGRLDRVVTLTPPTTEVALAPAPVLGVTVEGCDALPPGVVGEVVLAQRDRHPIRKLDDRHRAVFRLPFGGEWRAELRLRSGDGARRTVALGVVAWDPSRGPTETVLRPDPKELAAALAALAD